MTETPEARPALKVTQWLPSWDAADFNENAGRKKPLPYFYLISIPGKDLRRLSGIFRRRADSGLPRALEQGIQRRHNPNRSAEIAEYLTHGFPWSTLSKTKRASGEFDDLIKPGWLPTGIVVNILGPEDRRRGGSVHPQDLVRIEASPNESGASFHYPPAFGPEWVPRRISPLEVIDGQHRLWAFEESSDLDSFELPVIAFDGLDIGWQAYLFYTINIKPKRIDPSLAFDLYPLLRTADWLNRGEEHQVYRETRAQELVEALWSHPLSPWRDRIDMLGERGRKQVSQAAWIRALLASLIKSFQGRGVTIGGLFGGESGDREPILAWSRTQQAAFLIQIWRLLYKHIRETSAEWASVLRNDGENAGEENLDPAFAGPYTLLNTDQGIRGFLQAINDLCRVRVDTLSLASWTLDAIEEIPSEEAINDAIEALEELPLNNFLDLVAESFAEWDWRSSSAPGLSQEVQQAKMRFRGGSGYRELRLDLLRHASRAPRPSVRSAAEEALELVG